MYCMIHKCDIAALQDTWAQDPSPCLWRGCTRAASWGTYGPSRHPSAFRPHLRKRKQHRHTWITIFSVCILIGSLWELSNRTGKREHDQPNAWMQASTNSSTVADCSDNMDSILLVFSVFSRCVLCCCASFLLRQTAHERRRKREEREKQLWGVGSENEIRRMLLHILEGALIGKAFEIGFSKFSAGLHFT